MSSLKDRLANTDEKVDSTLLQFITLIGQIKKGLSKFFGHFAKQLSHTEEGTNSNEGINQITEGVCKQPHSPQSD